MITRIASKALRTVDPETGHSLAIKALRYGLVPAQRTPDHSSLKTPICGLDLANPIGLAAGFDKNAQALHGLSRMGFGFVEVGAATPYAQPGNPKPRMFRLPQDRAAINRFGFNNDGADIIATRLDKRPKGGIIGLNLGANKDSTDRAGDFAKVLIRCAQSIDFATVNVSSPNTEKLRDLQGKAALLSLLEDVISANRSLERPIPIWLKIAPDLTNAELSDIADVANLSGVDAIVATNTTLDRVGLHGRHKDERGGLSGAPLFEKSTRILARISEETNLPLIGVGGISSANQAYAKIQAGASALQLYTALAYQGFEIIPRIINGLAARLEADGFSHVSEAVGSDKVRWLR